MAQRRIRGWYWVDFRHNGVRHRKKSPINTKAGAAEFETILRMRLAKGEDIDAPPSLLGAPSETLAQFAEHWFDTYVMTNNKPSEQRTKRTILTVHLLPAFGTTALDDIGAEVIEGYKAQKLRDGLHPKTVNNHLAVLARCLRVAEEWGRLKKAPRARLLRVPEPEIDFLSRDEAARLVAADIEPAWHGMILVAVRAGLRLGELLALECRDADQARRVLTVSRSYVDGVLGTPKNGRTRRIPMTAELCRFFDNARPDGLLFCRPDGSPHRDHCSPQRALKRACLRAGIRSIGWHPLRHTFASDLVAASVTLPAVQKLLGHASITTTMRYAHLAPSAPRTAVDDLERYLNTRDTSEFGQPAGTATRNVSQPSSLLQAA